MRLTALKIRPFHWLTVDSIFVAMHVVTMSAVAQVAFVDRVSPLLPKYCAECLAGDDAEADITMGPKPSRTAKPG